MSRSHQHVPLPPTSPQAANSPHPSPDDGHCTDTTETLSVTASSTSAAHGAPRSSSNVHHHHHHHYPTNSVDASSSDGSVGIELDVVHSDGTQATTAVHIPAAAAAESTKDTIRLTDNAEASVHRYSPLIILQRVLDAVLPTAFGQAVHSLPTGPAEHGERSSPPASLRSQAFRSFAFVMTALLFICFMLNVVNMRMPDPKSNPPLPDLMFDVLPPMPLLASGTDVCMWCMNAAAIALALLFYLKHRAVTSQPIPNVVRRCFGWSFLHLEPNYSANVEDPQQFQTLHQTHRNLHLRSFIRYALTYGFSVLLRTLTLLSTSLPATANDCQHPQPIDNIWWNTLLGLLSLGSKNIHCGDLLFSGHTSVLIQNAAMLWWYGPLVHRWGVRLFAVFFSLSGALCILSSRSHYTDDVLIAVYVTWTVFLFVPEHVPRRLVPLLYPLSTKREMSKDE